VNTQIFGNNHQSKQLAQRTVHLFVFDTLSDWESGYAIAGINNSVFQTRPGQ
jgi:putative intracellular protease/amidase